MNKAIKRKTKICNKNFPKQFYQKKNYSKNATLYYLHNLNSLLSTYSNELNIMPKTDLE